MRLALVGFFAILCVGFGFGLGLGWDRHQPIGFTIPIVKQFVGLEGGAVVVSEARAVKAEAALAPALAASKACRTSLDAQGASIRSTAAIDAAKAGKAAHDLQGARAVAASLLRSRAPLVGYVPKGPDVCAEWSDVDAKVVGALR